MTIKSGNLIAAITGGAFYSGYVTYEAVDYVLDTPASILATWIVGVELMSAPSAGDDWPLFISYLPDGINVDDNIGAIYNTTPVKDARNMNTGRVIQHYGIEIMIRALSEESGWDKCNNISGNLDTLFNQAITKDDNTYTIHSISRVGGINSLGYEENTKRRRMFSMNFIVSITTV